MDLEASLEVITIEPLDGWTESGIDLSRNARLSDRDHDRTNKDVPGSIAH
jgi:hypothetical protein